MKKSDVESGLFWLPLKTYVLVEMNLFKWFRIFRTLPVFFTNGELYIEISNLQVSKGSCTVRLILTCYLSHKSFNSFELHIF